MTWIKRQSGAGAAASRGFGRAVAEELASEGASLVCARAVSAALYATRKHIEQTQNASLGGARLICPLLAISPTSFIRVSKDLAALIFW